MKKQAIFPKVAEDMFWSQLFWSLGFFGIMMIIYTVRVISAFITGRQADDFFSLIFVASNIFMFVIGILSISFIEYFVSNGVTRKDYFIGAAIASAALSITLPIMTGIISVVERLLVKFIGLPVKMYGADFNKVVSSGDEIGDKIGDIVQVIVMSPFVEPQNHWLLALVVFGLNLFVYYLAGWLISAAFYRAGVVVGLLFIAISIGVILLHDTLLRSALELPIHSMLASFASPMYISIIGKMLLVVLVFWLIRKLTKHVVVKM